MEILEPTMSQAKDRTDWPGQRVAFGAFAEKLARRRTELGIADADIPRNSGARRTDSKKALLKAIKDSGGDW